MSKDIRQFLEVVRKAGPDYYVDIKKPLKPYLEVCIIQQKLAKESRFPVIYCPEIEGSELPLVTDLFGSYEMFALALDMDPQKIDKAEILKEFRRREADTKPVQMIAASEAPIREVILKGEDVDLSLLPIIHHHELNSGKYVTIGCMICKDPDTGIPNVGVYRHEVKGKDKLGCQINPANHGAYIARRHAELGKPMEVIICIGHHPAMVLAACCRGSLDMNELEVMGGLLEEPVEVVLGETVDIPVPAYAEIAIEGVTDPNKWVADGPFSEYTGYYGSGSTSCYLIQVTGITMRRDAIYHDLDPGHREHGMSTVLPSESVVYEAVRRVVPTVKAVHFPPSGNCVNHIYVSIKKRVSGEAKLAALAALSAENMAKMVVVVDEDIDVYNEHEVLWAIATRTVGDKDISIIPGVSSTTHDPCAYDETRLGKGNMSSYIIIDATKPVGLPFLTRITPNQELWNTMNLRDYLKQ